MQNVNKTPFIVTIMIIVAVVAFIVAGFSQNRYWVEYTRYYTDQYGTQCITNDHCVVYGFSKPSQADCLEQAWDCENHTAHLCDSITIDNIIE